MANEKLSGLSVKVDVDVSEALTGLKALQREAKKATQVLRELETMYESEGKSYYTKWNQTADGEVCFNVYEVCLSDIPTEYLQLELSSREGVASYRLGLEDEYATLKVENGNNNEPIIIKGPATVTVNID